MKKTVLIIAALSAITLAGCSEGEIVYKGKLMPVSDAQEIMADELEVENPDLDLEVQIYEESED